MLAIESANAGVASLVGRYNAQKQGYPSASLLCKGVKLGLLFSLFNKIKIALEHEGRELNRSVLANEYLWLTGQKNDLDAQKQAHAPSAGKSPAPCVFVAFPLAPDEVHAEEVMRQVARAGLDVAEPEKVAEPTRELTSGIVALRFLQAAAFGGGVFLMCGGGSILIKLFVKARKLEEAKKVLDAGWTAKEFSKAIRLAQASGNLKLLTDIQKTQKTWLAAMRLVRGVQAAQIGLRAFGAGMTGASSYAAWRTHQQDTPEKLAERKRQEVEAATRLEPAGPS
jgi:hypothetical protein